MNLTQFFPELHQFTSIMEPIKLSMHQYLLQTGEPVLIQTGAVEQAKEILPKIQGMLCGKLLRYILISHFESDECGGVSLILKEYPDAVCICSETTARQLRGFGLAQNIEMKKPGEMAAGNDFEFQAIKYPSEMHLWEGLLFLERKRGILFSSDLMFRMGETHGQTITSTWLDAVENSGADQLPSPDMQKKLKNDLSAIHPAFVAPGHGPCIKVLW